MILVRLILSYNYLAYMDNVKPHRLLRNAIIAWIIVSFLLLLNLEYGVYSLGKLLIFGIDIYVISYIYQHKFKKKEIRLGVLVKMTVIFNPIFPIPFHKSTRQIFDILSWITLIITYIILNKDQPSINKIILFCKQKTHTLLNKLKF